MADLREIEASIRGRVRELDAQLAAVEDLRRERECLGEVLEALAPREAPAAGGRVTRSGAGRTRRRAASRSSAAPGQTRAAILAYLGAHPGSSAAAIAQEVGLKRSSVSTLLSRLARDGEIRRSAERGYELPAPPTGSEPVPDTGSEPVPDAGGELVAAGEPAGVPVGGHGEEGPAPG
ncbi:MarR family transcriptional regulator [Conexibacter sp. W3-3-2]|uniref:MarR family transcriptional regulator n=1 Tax=Conexibacter sp. W3-3-2 TaxID=2675227 RepID=UPI0012BA0538|nr:helix-turn-helix domain-containing protein [Conexibacter sp. W3-3-2]MTD47297.1 MarR family transcriptional regulator [Conexibacter sp. W3-3-2]